MGLSISLQCEKCNNTITLNIGEGLRDHDLSRVLSYFDDETQAIIKDHVTNSELEKRQNWSFRRMIAVCKVNGDIRSIPTFHTFTDGEDKLIAYNCVCGGDHTLISSNDLEEKKIICKCPKCGSKMTYAENGLWE